MKSYLTNRNQFISMSSISSNHRLIARGVPQGSILGPILFIIFMNDIFSINWHGKLQLYADDACLIYGGKEYPSLKHNLLQDLEKLDSWMNTNKLSINYSKTNFMIFQLKNIQSEDIFNQIEFKTNILNRVDVVKYLGLILNTNLNFTHHVNLIKNKIAKFVGVFRRIGKFLNESVKLSLYFAYIHSHIVYLNCIWGVAPEYKLKSIYGLPRLTPSHTLYGPKILPLVHLMHKFELNMIIFKLKNNLLKNNFDFNRNNQIHNHLTRIANNFRQILFRTNRTQN